MMKWRGIMGDRSAGCLPQRCCHDMTSNERSYFSHKVRTRNEAPVVLLVPASLGGSKLVVGSGDRCRYRAGDELLVVGRGELGDVGTLGRDFDSDGRSGHVVQRTQRRA